jgi:hypothetical protein
MGYSISSCQLAAGHKTSGFTSTYIANLENPFGFESHILALELLSYLEHRLLKESIFLGFRRGFVRPQTPDEVL